MRMAQISPGSSPPNSGNRLAVWKNGKSAPRICWQEMIELIQFPWSPFCIVQRRILEYSGVPFKITNIPSSDRSLVWRLTRERYYGVPVIRDGRNIVFETDNNSQVIAKYLDDRFRLGLFP